MLAPLLAALAPVAGCRVVATFPHSTASYTEGFFYRDGLFYEGAGLTGHSAILVTEPKTGRVVQRVGLAPELFGEGIVDWGANLLQWTWQTHRGFIYDRFSLRPVGTFTYAGEGWGMTRNARELITSDGTAVLRFRSPATFAETRRITVRDGAKPVAQLNEPEWIRSEIWANVWHSDRIARISPRDGRVLGWVDCTGLLPDSERVNSESVLNGIAYDAEHDRIFVTGKQWPTVFQIQAEPRPGAR